MLLTLPMGPLGANCYLWENGTDAAAVDPSDAEAVQSVLKEKNLRLTDVFLTHRHFDHLAGAAKLRQETGCAVWIHPLDADGLKSARASHADRMPGTFVPCEPTALYEDGDTVETAGLRLSVLHTPGHTAGGVTLVSDAEGLAFTGDTVFFEGVGRTDLATGNMRALMESLSRILKLPEDTVLYPGHGEPTTVAHESAFNPMLHYRGHSWFN